MAQINIYLGRLESSAKAGVVPGNEGSTGAGVSAYIEDEDELAAGKLGSGSEPKKGGF